MPENPRAKFHQVLNREGFVFDHVQLRCRKVYLPGTRSAIKPPTLKLDVAARLGALKTWMSLSFSIIKTEA
jgi:hypothetical protein